MIGRAFSARRAVATGALALLATSATCLGARAAVATSDTRDLTQYVDTLGGTLGGGFTFAGVERPFGMVQLGPDTTYPASNDHLDYTGYAYNDPLIRGFSLEHFSGAGIPIGGDLPVMPTVGQVTSTDPITNASSYDHATEVAQTGYYAVDLRNYGTHVELAATERAGIQRYTFPSTTQANVLIEAGVSVAGTHFAALQVVGDHTVTGRLRYEKNPPQGYDLYFTAVFDRAFSSFGTWLGSTISAGSRSAAGTGAGAMLTFDTSTNRVVNMRVGVSYVDAAGATANLDAEIPAGTSLDAVAAAGHDAWNRRLHDIEVTGGDPDQIQTFYTLLYRAFGMPSIFDDADGRYLGFDGVVRRVPAGTHHYTNLSLWDTYRAQNVLLSMVEPAVEHDILVSLLDDYDQSGQIPKWVYANLEYGIMGGDSGSAILGDGIARGILSAAEQTRAYGALRRQATLVPPAGPARDGLGEYISHGWIGFVAGSGRPVGQTLEYAIDDASLIEAARRMGEPGDAAAFTARSFNYRNLLDPTQKFTRPRYSDGAWADPTTADGIAVPWNPMLTDGYQESSGWQATWNSPHDVAGLATAIGGTAPTVSRLDEFFSRELSDLPLVTASAQGANLAYYGNQYTPSNETDLVTPWFYDWLGQPYKTQQVVRAAMDAFNSTPHAMWGNDDAGSMGSWYVMAALGIFGGAPGMPVYELNSPAFATSVVHLGSMNRSFAIDAPGASRVNKYVQSMSLDGTAIDRTYLTQCELGDGAHLSVTLGATANTAWASSPAAAPPSTSDTGQAPVVTACLDGLITAGSAPSANVPEVPSTPGLLGLGVVATLAGAARRRRGRACA